MSAKKIINEPSAVVDEALVGFAASHPGLALLPEYRVLYHKDAVDTKDTHVAVISGGGSGHEPAHIGYVGKGMLAAAVCGDVFASPNARQVHAAIKMCGGKAGVLLVVKCYTGDRLHFTLAAERARAEGIPVSVVVVSDDVAIPGHSTSLAGRRGLCGTVVAYKVAGALAARGATLQEVEAIAIRAGGQVGSLNVALGPCCAPGKQPSFTMAATDMELGLGIHGEAGYQRTVLQPAKAIVQQMIDIMMSRDPNRSYLPLNKGDDVALVINNLGSTTQLELSIVAGEALRCLDNRGIKVQRVYVGMFMAALDMPGISLTILKTDSMLVDLLDDTTAASAWPNHAAKHVPMLNTISHSSNVMAAPVCNTGLQLPCLRASLLAACKAIDMAEGELTAYDKIVGDGDCGTTLQDGANALSVAIDTMDLSSPERGLREMSRVLEEHIGGSSGALYCIGLEAAATAIQSKNPNDPASWYHALVAGTKAIMQLGANKGDRTMLDALLPACEVLASTPTVTLNTWQEALQAADNGAQSTASMTAGAGRSTYVNKDIYMGTPDPGAMAVAIWLKAAVNAL